MFGPRQNDWAKFMGHDGHKDVVTSLLEALSRQVISSFIVIEARMSWDPANRNNHSHLNSKKELPSYVQEDGADHRAA